MDDEVTEHWSDYDIEGLDPAEHPTLEDKRGLWEAAGEGPDAFKEYVNSAAMIEVDQSRLLLSPDDKGRNFLHMAAETGNWRVVRALDRDLHHCFYRHPPAPRWIPALHRDLPVKKDNNGNTPLHIAAGKNHLDFVKALIKYHMGAHVSDPVDVEVQTTINHTLVTPLMRPPGTPNDRVNPRNIPYLSMKNAAGRTAAEEAEFAAADTTRDWLDRYWKQCQEAQAVMQDNQ